MLAQRHRSIIPAQLYGSSIKKENKYLAGENDSQHSNSYGHLPKADDILRGPRGSHPTIV